MTQYKKPKHLWRDMSLIALGFIIGYFLYLSHPDLHFISSYPLGNILVSFIAGIFFTSAFTIVPAGVFLAELMSSSSALEVAFFGSLGALCGDLIIFAFIRDNLSEDLTYLIRIARPKRYKHLIKFPFVRFIIPLLGAVIIASPLPDELGLALMGLSKTKTSILIPIAFGMNFLGIILIAAAIHAL